MKNVLSIDVEHWWYRPVLDGFLKNVKLDPNHVVPAVQEILRVLEKHGRYTTFFVLGEIAETYPTMVEEIYEKGHEVASHGYTHKKIFHHTPDEFREETRKTSKLITKLTGERPLGFRARMFTLTKDSSWALAILADEGHTYDSSIFPMSNPLYQSSKAPTIPYKPSFADPTERDPNQNYITEYPLLTFSTPFGTLPASGGFYFRALGPNFIKRAIKQMNKNGYPAVCYFHPWELYGFPDISLPYVKKKYVYYGVPGMKSFEYLVKNVDIVPARLLI